MENIQTKKRIEWWSYSVPILTAIFILSQVTLLFRVWGKFGPIVYLLTPLMISVLAIFFILIGIIYSIIKPPFIKNNRIIWLMCLALFPLSFFLRLQQQGNLLNSYPSSHYKKISKVNYRIPFDTLVSVGWGGEDLENNYHVIAPDQRWAYDILIIRDNASFVGDGSKLDDYFIYGLPILSPADGEVVKVLDFLPDLKIGEELEIAASKSKYGNYVMIKTDSNEYVMLCHIKPKTTKVKVGEKVKQGQEIGSVGNSGNTSEPHLHIHLQDSKNLDFAAEGIPLYFHNYLADGKPIKMGMPKGGIKDTLWIGQNIQHSNQ